MLSRTMPDMRKGWMGEEWDGWAKDKVDGLGLGQVLVDGPEEGWTQQDPG